MPVARVDVTPIVGGSDDEAEIESEPYRCLFVNCASAQLVSPGWLSKQSLVSHINNVHMAAGQMPTEEMLRVLGRGVCQKCKVLITTRGCP